MMRIEQRKISSAMSDALYQGNFEDFKRLYLASLSIGQAGNWLYKAARDGNHDAIRFLIEQGHSPNEKSGGTLSQSALSAVCSEGFTEGARLLLRAGASIDVGSFDDNPLFNAITAFSIECVMLLMDANIDIHKIYLLEDGRRRNALEYAMSRGCMEIVEHLRSKRAVLPEEDLTIVDVSSSKKQSIAALRSWFRSEPPNSAGTIGLGKNYGGAELLWFDMSTMDHPFLTVFTVGLSNHAIETPSFGEGKSRIELMMHLPFTWPMDGSYSQDIQFQWPLNWMRLLPQHILDGSVLLPGTHVIISNDEPPAPLGPGTEQTCLLLIADFYQCFPVQVNETETVHFYHVVPLYTEERDFEKANGMKPLLEAMAAKGLESLVIRPDRERFV